MEEQYTLLFDMQDYCRSRSVPSCFGLSRCIAQAQGVAPHCGIGSGVPSWRGESMCPVGPALRNDQGSSAQALLLWEFWMGGKWAVLVLMRKIHQKLNAHNRDSVATRRQNLATSSISRLSVEFVTMPILYQRFLLTAAGVLRYASNLI
jgi:hypothetical protein